MKIIVITGGDGYIGSAIKRALRLRTGDEEIKVVSIDFNPKSEDTLNYDLSSDIDIDNLYSELTSRDAQGGNEYFGWIHCAAWKDLNASYDLPFEYYDNNLKSLLNSLKLAHMLNVKKFIFSSSAAVYPDDLIGETLESELDLNKTSSPYGMTKAIGERIVHEIATQFHMESICFRYGNPMGTDGTSIDLSTTMFGNIVRCLHDSTTFHIYGGNYPYGDGTCIRDYIDLQNLVDAHVKVLDRDFDMTQHLSVNLGSGKEVSCLKICKIVKELYPQFKYDIIGRRKGDAYGCYFNTNKARKLGVYGYITLQDSIKNLIETASKLEKSE